MAAFTAFSLKGSKKVSLAICPSATISKLKFPMLCKCQTFVTHNLFISLHIRLVMECDQGWMHAYDGDEWDCTSSSSAITDPSCSSCDIVIVYALARISIEKE